MKTSSLVGVVLLFGVGAYVLIKYFKPATPADQLRAQIFSLPGELKFGERRELAKQSDVGVLQGATAGAQTGAIGGPWGIAIGAGAGAIASAFT